MKLVLAEKPSVGASIAAVLNAKKREDGFFIGSNGYIVSWCVGHLVEFAQADEYDLKYAKWKYADLPIIPAEWKYNIAKDKKKQLKIISDLMKRSDVDTVICATDAGREGELIFRLVYEYCKCKKPIQRLWISSMEEKAIADGFRNLKDGSEYDRLYKSALCRAQADWIVGINATRLFSVLYNATLNVGRVQSPTLALIVEREKEINAFVKEPFYTVELDCHSFTASGEKLKDRQAAEDIQAVCDGKTARITSVEKQEKSMLPPKLYDLTTLQREANRLYGFTSQQTLDYAQSLYEKKLATYPRTDSRYLTEDMAAGLPALIYDVAGAVPFTKGLSPFVDVRRVVDNKKVTDHHAIIPTQTMTKTDLSSLPTGEREILYMIAVRLICAVGDKHVYNETTVTVECENYIFKAKGKNVLKDGWKAVEQTFKDSLKNKPDDDGDDDKALPELNKGQVFEKVKAEVREGFTTPPKHFTEDTLLSAMECAGDFSDIPDAERKGLGTPATRAAIIEKLVKTGFIERQKKSLIPLQKGISLITVLPEVIKSPALTANWEGMLKQIEKGEISNADFMDGIVDLTDGLVKTNSAPNPEYASLFGTPRQLQGEALGLCPRCGKSVYDGGKGFFCENKTCGFSLWKDNKFFTAKKKMLTAEIAAVLLKEGRVHMTGLYSEKTGKTYNAVITLDDSGGKWVNFKMEFENKKNKH
ncbi:MAG: DNA topoisomerase 3 [Oscillospiraceae bacterium]|nr:DNA topoisomerase 3 [Oscillospiraceae bacterium]